MFLQTVAQQTPAATQNAAVLTLTLGQVLAWGFAAVGGICALLGGFLVWYAKKAVEKLSSIDTELKAYKTHVELTYKQKSECTGGSACDIAGIVKIVRDAIHKEAKSLVKMFADKSDLKKAKA